MGVQYEYQTMLTCDTCGEWVAEMQYACHMITYYREQGWKIGKYVTCPNCVERKRKERPTCGQKLEERE